MNFNSMCIAAAVALSALLTDAAPPQRIVSLGGPVTETVFALGLGDQVVAVDLSSTYPAQAATRPKVGYIRAISAEGVLSMRPDLVIGTDDAGPRAALEQLHAAKTHLVLVPSEHTVEGARLKIRAVAKALGVTSKGEELVKKLDRDLAAAHKRMASSKTKPNVLFVYARGQGTLSVSGGATAADAMIHLAGGTNAVTGYTGYKPLTPEALATAKPEIIVLTTAGLQSVGGIDGLLAQPGVGLTPAGRQRRIIALDDELLLGFGPRLGLGVLEMARAIHPELR
jgi:iron complex transport system substrate-binding protein